jgi:hypothetical protein
LHPSLLVVSTPLWTGEQAKHVHSQFSYTDDVCITPEEVAEAMKELIELPKYPGGTLLEVKKGDLRHLRESEQAVIIPGDQETPEMKEWFDRLCEPVREVFAKERGRQGGA